MCPQYENKVDEKGRINYSDFGSKTNREGLKCMKVYNKVICQYKTPGDEEHCIVNIFLNVHNYIECSNELHLDLVSIYNTRHSDKANGWSLPLLCRSLKSKTS